MVMLQRTTQPAATDDHLLDAERRARELFAQQYGAAPRWAVAAPGRVNIIGEHTDYNDGYVLPMAIERYVVIAAAPTCQSHAIGGESAARIFSANMDQEVLLQLSGRIEPGPVTWASYAQGVLAGFAAQGWTVESFDAVIYSSVPLGGGLSSSAALEVATATLVEAMRGESLDPREKALLCQQAEHRFAGVPCGIMDQFSSVLCQASHLMLLDCRSQAVEMVPLTDRGIAVVIANSNVRRELASGEYAQRRAQCEEAARLLGVGSLRDAASEQVAAAGEHLGPLLSRRARHVVSENDRTVRAAAAIAGGDWNEVGELMYASHASLRDDYEVSCPELDLLVELARRQPGVIGSRMTGGGFGGCTVSLVRADQAAEIMRALSVDYQARTKIEPTVFMTRPAAGAQVLG